jgi:hypothetical protein
VNSDFLDMLSALSDEGAEFLIVGAFAMAAHGCVRATGDIDIWIRPTPDNASRVWRALQSFGAPTFDLHHQDLSTPDIVFQIGLPPRRIDILTSIAGVSFEAAWPMRLNIQLGTLPVSVIGREHLIQNKLATGRATDRADAEWLQQPPANP